MNLIKKAIYSSIIPLIGEIRRRKNKFVNVIYYHDIVNPDEAFSFMRTSRDFFEKHMHYIADKGIQTLTFAELDDSGNIAYSPNKILITFDDGWKSNYDILSFMKKLGIKYNVFLEVGKIGVDPNYLTWQQIKEMHESGMVGFGAHTFNHPNLKNPDCLDIKYEILDANAEILKNIGVQPMDFCFPYGAYSEDTLKKLLDTKIYKRIYTSNLLYSYHKNNAIIFGRNGISNDESFKVFKNKLKGNYNTFYSLCRLLRK